MYLTSKVENYLENHSFQLEFLTVRGFILTNLGFKEVVLYLKYAVVQEGLGIVCGLNKLIFYWSIFSSKRKLRQS